MSRAPIRTRRLLGEGGPTLAIFQGPHAYVSPGWYAAHPSVPTWNYVAVHAYGRPALIEAPDRVKALLARLVETYETGRAAPWRFDSLAADYVDGMIRGIVAFEMPIERLEGKAKLSQNRGAEDRAGAIRGLEATADPLAVATAALMREAREALSARRRALSRRRGGAPRAGLASPAARCPRGRPSAACPASSPAWWRG